MAAKIAKGIVGIRKIKETNHEGWHIFLNGEYMHYDSQSFSNILSRTDAILTGVTGNGLSFITTEDN